MTKKLKTKQEKARERNYKHRYGITLEEYEDMLKDQDGKCACCGTTKPGGRWGTFNVDHCHGTNKIRGLLCKNCNITLGLMDDSLEQACNLINYILKHGDEYTLDTESDDNC